MVLADCLLCMWKLQTVKVNLKACEVTTSRKTITACRFLRALCSNEQARNPLIDTMQIKLLSMIMSCYSPASHALMVGQSGFAMDGLGGNDMGWTSPRFLAYNAHTSQDESNNVQWQQLLLELSATDQQVEQTCSFLDPFSCTCYSKQTQLLLTHPRRKP